MVESKKSGFLLPFHFFIAWLGGHMTLVEMLEKNCEIYTDKTAIIYKNKRISYLEIRYKSYAVADFLIKNGLKKGDRVGVLLPKTPDAIISFLGIARAGGVMFPVDFSQPISVIQNTIKLARPVALIFSAKFQQFISELYFPKNEVFFLIVGEKEKIPSWGEVVSCKIPEVSNVTIDRSDPVYLNFTSGSTGFPKGAITTHDNLYWNTRAVVESFGLVPEDVHLCGFPVFTHPHELFCRALYTGGQIVLTDDSLPNTIARAVLDHKVTCLMAISLIYENFVRYQVSPEYLKSLRIAESAGMHVGSSLVENFKKIFNISITPAWGSTETAGIALANPIYAESQANSVGKPLPYYEIKIIDDAANVLGVNEIGEMIIKGPGVCSGYFHNSEASSKTFHDGWLFTGDLVKKDNEGYFYFITRKSRMIKVAGQKVYPTEIEEVLNKHPEIIESAAVGIEDDVLGAVPKAVVVLRDDSKITELELRKYCASKLAKYKVPISIKIVTSLPKAPSGKILYKAL